MGRDEDKNKKKLIKKSIDIESEFIGKPVEPKKKKEKKDDLTDEIKKFLDEPINLDSIKRIMLRLRGPVSEFEIQKSKIFVYAIPRTLNSKKYIDEFLVRINTHKWSYIYFLSHFLFADLSFFSRKKIDESILKQDLGHSLRRWFENNLDKITVLPD